MDVERGRGLGGFEGKRTWSSTSPPRRRREREEDGGVGRDVRATQQELAPVPRGAGTALGLSVLLSQSRVPGVGVVPSVGSRNSDPIRGPQRESLHDYYLQARAAWPSGCGANRPLTQSPKRVLRARRCRSRCSTCHLGYSNAGKLPNCDKAPWKLNTATPNGQILLTFSHRPGVCMN